MPQARIKEGKRYRYWRKTGSEPRKDRYGNKYDVELGEWVYAEGGEVIEVTPNSLKACPDFLEAHGTVESIGEQDEQYADSESVLGERWQAVCKSVAKIDDPELLASLREAESENRARGSVLDAIDAAIADCENGGEPDDEEGDDEE